MQSANTNKTQWILNRLSLMSPIEMLYRLGNFIYSNYERNTKLKKTPQYTYKGFGKFILSEADISLIKKYYNQNTKLKNDLLENAENVVCHRLSYFIMNNFFLGEDINWHKDYPSNKVCEYKFYADINYRNSDKYGDVKYIWELNRFLHLYKLSQALLVTKEKRYSKAISSQIDSWIKSNHYLMGINWVSALEVAIRLIAWSWAYASIKLSGTELDKEFEERFIQSVYQHADYIQNHFSKFSSANNHLIGEASALIIAGTVFDFNSASKNWITTGLKILESEIVKQTFEDGMNKEQAPSYHMFVFDFFMLAKQFAQKAGYKTSSTYDSTLKKMAEAMVWLADNAFNIPNIGDNDEGQVVNLCNNPDVNPLLSMFDIAAIMFNDSKLKFNTSVDEKALWLTGIEGLKTITKLEKQEKPQNSKYLNDSGYYILNNENIHAVFDVGNLGYLSLAAHGHADALNFLLTYKEKRLISDSGTYAYHSKPEWRSYFKGTSSHNTVCVNKKDQSVSGGNFMWIKKADVKVEQAISSDKTEYIKASHDGYIKQGLGVNHTREVLFEKSNYFIIVDKLTSDKKQHTFDLNWQFFYECDVLGQDGTFKVKNKDAKATLNIVSSDESIGFNVYKGSAMPKAGWYSQGYDKLLMSTTLTSSITSSTNVAFVTVISFDDDKVSNMTLDDNKLNFKFNNENKEYDINSLIAN